MNRMNSVLLPILVVLVSVVALLLLAGTNPWEPLKIIIEGSIGWPPFEGESSRKVGDTFMVWVPIALASAGLIVTFNAGMWNIGIEGQIIMGAITAAFVAREVSAPRPILILLTILAGAAGGMLWGLLVGVLRTAGGVNEIFGGLGLDFVALSLTTYLIIGPWARSGVASTSGTDPFPSRLPAALARFVEALSAGSSYCDIGARRCLAVCSGAPSTGSSSRPSDVIGQVPFCSGYPPTGTCWAPS